MTLSRNLTKIAFIVFALLFVYACTKKSNSSGTLTTADLDSLQTQFSQINSDIDQAWVAMMVDDDGKIENLKRLLQEVVYSNSYDQAKVDSLQMKVEAVEKMRYDQETMKDSDLITQYDLATENVIAEINDYVTSLPAFQTYALMPTLVDEVMQAEERVLRFRVDYDRAIYEYNGFIDQNSSYMADIDPDAALESKPMFAWDE